MSHEVVVFPNGSCSVKPLASPEAMHSHIGPWAEAELIYVGQSELADRLREPGAPLVLFDLGLGIAANALAAIECFVAVGAVRDLRIFSFEKHLDGLRVALQSAERFPWVAKHRAALEELLSHGRVTLQVAEHGRRIDWQLFEGDFLDSALSGKALAADGPADVIFFDFYSPKACPELWEVGCFEKIYRASSKRAVLLTYGASTAARSAMLLAGFNVGIGCSTTAKSETTVAAVCRDDLRQPLGAEWLAKLARSEKPLPAHCEAPTALAQIFAHPQFKHGETLPK